MPRLLNHFLVAERTLAEVRDAAGHCNVSITSSYLHVVVEENEEVGRLFGQVQETALKLRND